MTVDAASDVYFDPYDVDDQRRPVPDVFKRLREEAPLYYNAQHDFYALSRYEDVNRGIVDHGTFSSAKGAIIELIKADFPIPSGVLIFEDPPIHDIHRKLLARMFTPRKIALLEEKIREYCVDSLDPVVGTGKFDFVTDLGAVMPMKTISALIGIPEADEQAIRDHVTEPDEDRGGQADEGRRGGPGQRRHLRRLHRLARRQPVRRHHDRTAQRRVRRRDRHHPQAHPRRTADLPQRRRRRGQRHHHPADRLGRQRFSPSTPISGASWSRIRR